MTCSTHVFHPARTFPRLFSCLCFLVAFGLTLSAPLSPARAVVSHRQDDADNGLEMKALRDQETSLKATIDYLETTLEKLKTGKYMFGPFKTSGNQAYFGLVDKDVYAGFIAVKMFQENKTALDWVKALRNMAKMSRAAVDALQEQLDAAKEALDDIQKKLAANRRKSARTDKPRPRTGDSVSLELDSSTVDRKGAQNADQWDVDKEGGEATYTPGYGKAKFEFKMPDSIGPEGEKIKFGVTVTAKKGTRFAPAMSMVGDADLTGGNPQVYPTAESGMTADEFKDVTITPRKYSEETKFVNIQVRFQDGPTITYKYRVVR